MTSQVEHVRFVASLVCVITYAIRASKRNKLRRIKKLESDSSSIEMISEQYLSDYISNDEDYGDVKLQAAHAAYKDELLAISGHLRADYEEDQMEMSPEALELRFDGNIGNIACITWHQQHKTMSEPLLLTMVAQLLQDARGHVNRQRAQQSWNE